MTMYFTKEHEWIRVEGNNATVGISNHAQEQLGDIVFAEAPEAGRSLRKGEEAAVVESVKAASDVYSPISGTVIEGNPLVDFSATKRVRMVIKDGMVMDTSYDPKWVNPVPRPSAGGR